jgi:hypothetical protein
LEAVPPPAPAELNPAGTALWTSLFDPAETPALDPLCLDQTAAAPAEASPCTAGAAPGAPSDAARPEEGLLPVYRVFLEASQAAASGASGVAPAAFALAEQTR